jgi:adenylate cyclase
MKKAYNKLVYIFGVIILIIAIGIYKKYFSTDSDLKRVNNIDQSYSKYYAENSHSQKWADSLLAVFRKKHVVESNLAIRLADSLTKYYLITNQTCQEIEARQYLAKFYSNIGEYEKCTVILQKIIDKAKINNCSIELQSSLSVTLSSLYLSMEDYSRLDSLVENILKNPSIKLWTSKSIAGLKFNQGIALANLGNIDKALIAFREIYEIGKKDNNQTDTELGLLNMATIFAIQGNFAQAKEKFFEVLTTARKNPIDDHLFRAWSNLGILYSEEKKFDFAMLFLDSALNYAQKNKDLEAQKDAMLNISHIYEGNKDYKNALISIKQYNFKRDSLLNTAKIKAIADVKEKYETEKKAKENTLLRNKSLELELERSSAVRTRNIYLFIGLSILGGLMALWGRLRIVSKSRKEIRKEKEISENLLLNILPFEVAEELKAKGSAEAKLIDEVTVLFTDFKGFTQLSEKLSPKELVAEINECFSAFDYIMQKYGVEKIKTIGDAYMAAGGIPIANETHAEDVVKAALEIQQFMIDLRDKKEEERKLFFEIRIGVHTGPVVAGIVGVKKFSYDIWGDTVNTASRMESSGEAGKLNISGTTYELVKNKFKCTHRGKIEAKGKGEIDMYFVEEII